MLHIIRTKRASAVELEELRQRSLEHTEELNRTSSGVVFMPLGTGNVDEDIVETGEDVTSSFVSESPGANQQSRASETFHHLQNKARERLLAFVFGIAFIIVMLALALFVPEPKPFQYLVFRIILAIAIAVAGAAAMIPGFIEVEVPTFVRAGGAIAVFVVVFFYNPAALVVQSPDPSPNPVVTHSGTKSSGVMAEFSPWYPVCGQIPDNAKISSVRFTLSGDRTACGIYSECRQVSQDARRVCYEFRTQGHNEWKPPGQGSSEGTLELGWERSK